MQKKMETLCPLPWLHISADFNEDLRLCCNAALDREVKNDDGQVIKLSEVEDFEQFLNNPTLVSIRKAMMDGHLPKACSICEKIDCSGGTSPRQHNLNQYKEVFPELLAATDEDGHFHGRASGPKFFDMSLGNRCNLKCRMCSPVFSHSLLPIFEKLNLQDQYDHDKVLSVRERWLFDEKQRKTIEKWLPSMDKILIQGGEPFYTPQVWNFLQWAVNTEDSKHIYLKITTNLTTLPVDKLNILTEFKSVHFNVSLEGTKEFNDYIREGGDWDTVAENLDKLKQLKKVYPFSFNIHTVLQSYNLANTLEFISLCEKRWDMWPTFGLLYYPDFLSAQILPRNYKKTHCSKIKEYIESRLDSLDAVDRVNGETLNAHMNFLMKDSDNRDYLWSRFINYTEGLDEHYKKDWRKLVGELDE